MPARNRPLMIVSGILTLVFGSMYLTLWMIATINLGIVPWLDDLGFLVIEIFSGIVLIAGLVLVLVAVIIPDYPIITMAGGLLTIFFGALFMGFSTGLHLPIYSPFWYAWIFVIMAIVTAIIFLVTGYQTHDMTPKGVEGILKKI